MPYDPKYEPKCPVCGAEIDLDDVDVNDNDEDGYGEMHVHHECPECRHELDIVFDAQNGYDFDRVETV